MTCKEKLVLESLFPTSTTRIGMVWLWYTLALLPPTLLFIAVFCFMCMKEKPFVKIRAFGLHNAISSVCTLPLVILVWYTFDIIAGTLCEFPNECDCVHVNKDLLRNILPWRPLAVGVGVLVGSIAHVNNFVRKEWRLFTVVLGASASTVITVFSLWKQSTCGRESTCSCEAESLDVFCKMPLHALSLFIAVSCTIAFFPMKHANIRSTSKTIELGIGSRLSRHAVDPTAEYVPHNNKHTSKPHSWTYT